ncbi:MAG TPA: heme ABC transporter ATP-binding protein [Ignavibacteria bacterium]|nr:heme ABC transporter ATP-binding protein [Ignavibacteria bacterium]
MLEVKNVEYVIGGKKLLKNVSLDFLKNEFVVVMGQNGAGKTTLLNILAGSLKPTGGEVSVFKKKIESFDKTDLAKKRAVLSQHYDIAFPISVEEIVMMGRYPHFLNVPSKDDIEIVSNAIDMMGMSEFKLRDYNTLSGGEAQKVQMARVISQIWQEDHSEPKILFLDEPVSSLDMHYQHLILKLIREYSLKNILVIGVIHDINLAFEYADRVIFMKNGSVVKSYNSKEAIDTAVLKEIFEIEIGLIKNPYSDKPMFAVKNN